MLEERARGSARRPGIDMRAWLKELRTMGKPILVSSHILPELADICNKIGIIERGKLLFDGDVQTAIQKVRQRTRIDVGVGDGKNAEAKLVLEKTKGIDEVEHKTADDYLLVTLGEGLQDGSFIAETLLQNGFRLKMLKEEAVNLEDVF